MIGRHPLAGVCQKGAIGAAIGQAIVAAVETDLEMA